jgi:general nucleoside transport system permease protein
MSVVVTPEAVTAPEEPRSPWRLAIILSIALLLVSGARVVSGAGDIDSTGALRSALVAAMPIMLAGLGGLWSERAGVVNIGLEGMMMLGTLGAGYLGYHHGAVVGVLGAVAFGLIGGLLHALMTVIFGVDHIISGVAINIMALGITGYLAETWFTGLPGGGQSQSPPLPRISTITIDPVVDLCHDVEDKGWFLVSDVFSVVGVLFDRMSVLTLVALALVPLTAWVLWRTAFGLRIRSTGEAPAAAESLGVNVYLYKCLAVAISGALAGLGGAVLTNAAGGYQNNMTVGLGYIGLAAMIFGNWRPGGLLIGALLFGYAQAIQLRSGEESLHGLLLVIVVVLVALAVVQVRAGARVAAAVAVAAAGLTLVWFLFSDEVPREFTGMAPYLTTLLVLTFASQSLRMPKADGQIYRKGSAG